MFLFAEIKKIVIILMFAFIAVIIIASDAPAPYLGSEYYMCLQLKGEKQEKCLQELRHKEEHEKIKKKLEDLESLESEVRELERRVKNLELKNLRRQLNP